MQRCAFCQGELDPATRICRACGRVQPPADDDITLVPPPKGAGARATNGSESAGTQFPQAPAAVGALTRPCPNCGTLLPAAARFCGRCGQALESLAGETPGKLLHDMGKPPEGTARDEAITNVLKPPVKLADMPAEAPKVTLAAGGAPRRHDMDTRQVPGGVAHGLRYRMLSRMQARIITTALVALLVIGGTAYSQAGLNASVNTSNAIPTPTAAVATPTAAAPTPTATPGVTPTPGPATPTATPTPIPVTPVVTATPAAAATGGSSPPGSVGALVARIILLLSIIGVLILLILLGLLTFRRLRARST